MLALKGNLGPEFDYLQKLGQKFSVQTLLILVKNMIQYSFNNRCKKDLRFGERQKIISKRITMD